MKDNKYLIYTNKELVATKICGPSQEHIQVSEGTSVEVPGGCKMKLDDHQIYGEESIHHTSKAKTQVFDRKWDAKHVLRNISQPVFLQAVKYLEEAAGVVSFETEDVLQQVDLNSERRKSRNLFSWAKWITPIIAGIMSFLLSIIVVGLVQTYLRIRRPRRSSKKSSGPQVHVDHLGLPAAAVVPPSAPTTATVTIGQTRR